MCRPAARPQWPPRVWPAAGAAVGTPYRSGGQLRRPGGLVTRSSAADGAARRSNWRAEWAARAGPRPSRQDRCQLAVGRALAAPARRGCPPWALRSRARQRAQRLCTPGREALRRRPAPRQRSALAPQPLLRRMGPMHAPPERDGRPTAGARRRSQLAHRSHSRGRRRGRRMPRAARAQWPSPCVALTGPPLAAGRWRDRTLQLAPMVDRRRRPTRARGCLRQWAWLCRPAGPASWSSWARWAAEGSTRTLRSTSTISK